MPMRRRGSNERLARFRENRVDDLKDFARMAARWVVDNFDVLREGDTEMPECINDRAQDNYRMLVTIADTAGGDWPQRVRDAIAALAGGDGQASPAEFLLGDVRDIFDARRADKIASAALVDHLIQLASAMGVAQPTHPRSHAGSVWDRSSRYSNWEENSSRV